MQNEENKPGVFTPRELRAFRIYAIEIAVIAIGLWYVAPSRSGKILGVLFAVALLPVPPVVLYAHRKMRLSR
jgi:hypothetical protein